MFVNFEDAVNPSPERLRQYDEALKRTMREALAQKKCWMCANTYTETCINHGHQDTVRVCVYTHNGVGDRDGAVCSCYKPRKIEEA